MTIQPSVNVRTSASGAKDILVTWAGLTYPTGADPDGGWFGAPGLNLRSWSVQGTLGTGGSVSMKASNNDCLSGAGISGTQADEGAASGPVTGLGIAFLGAEGDSAASFRPLVTVGDSTTLLTITAMFKQGG